MLMSVSGVTSLKLVAFRSATRLQQGRGGGLTGARGIKHQYHEQGPEDWLPGQSIPTRLGGSDLTVGITSLACTKDGMRQFPFLDLSISKSVPTHDLVDALKELGDWPFALVETEASYHYYGFKTLSNKEWQDFMGRSLLLEWLTDIRWVGHMLIDGYACLRLVATPEKPWTPHVVASFRG